MEGGLLAWKRQTVTQNGPPCDYSCLRLGLPAPPKGKKWHKNEETKEWSLVDDDEIDTKKDTSKNSNNGAEKEHTTNYLRNEFQMRLAKMKDKDLKKYEYFEHLVLPKDTFQGICITYKISATLLRQVNMFSGTNLKLAPTKLIIPVQKTLINAGKIRLQDKTSVEYKIHSLHEVFPDMTKSEAKYYLDLAEQDIEKAMKEAHSDIQWEKEHGLPKKGDISSTLSQVSEPDITVTKREHDSIPITTLNVHEGVPLKLEKNSWLKNKNQKNDIEMIPLIK